MTIRNNLLSTLLRSEKGALAIGKRALKVKPRKPLWKRVLSSWQLYVFLLLPMIYLIVFRYVPMIGLQIAFRKFRAVDGIFNSQWVGWDNFARFFSSPQFKRILPNTIYVSVYSLIAGFPLPIILALILNSLRNQKLMKFSQTVTYLPYFISTVVLVSILMQVLNPRVGLVANIAGMLGIESIPNLMADPKAFRHLYVWSGIWQATGYNSIIYIASLASTDPELHEAAEIDGANRFQRVLHIDLPTIIPTASILLIMNAGRVMTVGFEKVYLMQNNMNVSTSQVISTYVYEVGIASTIQNFSYATSIDLFNSVINFLLIVSVNQLSKRFSSNSIF